jgi:hypothetical protein
MAERKHGIPDRVNSPGQHDPYVQEPNILPVRFLRVVDARRRLAQGCLIPQPELIARALILRASLD